VKALLFALATHHGNRDLSELMLISEASQPALGVLGVRFPAPVRLQIAYLLGADLQRRPLAVRLTLEPLNLRVIGSLQCIASDAADAPLGWST